MNTIKKIGIFFLLFLALIGMISAPIALGMYHSWLPMVGSLIADAFALKSFITLAKKLME